MQTVLLYEEWKRGAPQAVFFMGTSGSGKSTLQEEEYDHLPAIDVDDIVFEIGGGEYDRSNVPQAIAESKKRTYGYIENGRSFAKVGVGANLSGLLNFMLAAKREGFNVEVVYVDVGVDEAIRRVQQRAEETGRGHDLKPKKVKRNHVASMANYKLLTGQQKPNSHQRPALEKADLLPDAYLDLVDRSTYYDTSK